MRSKGFPWTWIRAAPEESVSRLESGKIVCPRRTTRSPRRTESRGAFSQTPLPRGMGRESPGSPRSTYLRATVFTCAFLAPWSATPTVCVESTRGRRGKSRSTMSSFSCVLSNPNPTSVAAMDAAAPPAGVLRRSSPSPPCPRASNCPKVQLKNPKREGRVAFVRRPMSEERKTCSSAMIWSEPWPM